MRKWITVAAAAVLVGMVAQPVAAQMSLGIHAGGVYSKFTGNGITPFPGHDSYSICPENTTVRPGRAGG